MISFLATYAPILLPVDIVIILSLLYCLRERAKEDRLQQA